MAKYILCAYQLQPDAPGYCAVRHVSTNTEIDTQVMVEKAAEWGREGRYVVLLPEEEQEEANRQVKLYQDYKRITSCTP